MFWRAGPTPLSLLAPYERAKAMQIRTASARAVYLAAHLLIREAAAVVTGLPTAAFVLHQRCPECDGSHGPPTFVGHPGLYVSMSHSLRTVAAVAGRTPVAIDVEDARAPGRADLLQASVFTTAERTVLARIGDPRDHERALLGLWVRKRSA